MPGKRLATISVSGPDRKGIVARFATFLFQNNLNIEDIDQHVEVDRFVMTMQFDLAELRDPLEELETKLRDLGKQLQMDVRLRLERDHPEKNIAILVTKEAHALDRLLRDAKSRRFRGRICAVIGNQRDLEPACQKAKVPFYHVDSENRVKSERKIMQLLKSHDVDLVVLARYMQILSPALVFLYRGRSSTSIRRCCRPSRGRGPTPRPSTRASASRA